VLKLPLFEIRSATVDRTIHRLLLPTSLVADRMHHLLLGGAWWEEAATVVEGRRKYRRGNRPCWAV
jgi:hypothetical protein